MFLVFFLIGDIPNFVVYFIDCMLTLREKCTTFLSLLIIQTNSHELLEVS